MKMNPKYAGIGSRSTPPETLSLIESIAARLAEKGWVLRSGGADGADSAFEKGCDQKQGTKEIFLPWKKFNSNNSPLFNPTKECFELAAKIHPAWDNCSDGAKRLHARNCQQILGQDLDDPVSLVICWTLSGGVSGGTATAMKIAMQNNIPIVNLANQNDVLTLKDKILAIDKEFAE